VAESGNILAGSAEKKTAESQDGLNKKVSGAEEGGSAIRQNKSKGVEQTESKGKENIFVVSVCTSVNGIPRRRGKAVR